MYKMQPILANVELESPTCMYGMKSIYANFNCRNTDIGNDMMTTIVPGVSEKHSSKPKPLDILQQIDKYLKCKEGDDLNIIAERQQNILMQLKCLEDKLIAMRLELGVCTKGTISQSQSSSSNNQRQNTKVMSNNNGAKEAINQSCLQEIVINANPCNIPYSLLAFKNIWKQQINVNVNFYTHSTIVELSMEAKIFAEQLTINVNNQSNNNALPTMNVSLIWKNVECFEMLCPMTGFLPIWGECNLLRYLSRIGPSAFFYEMQSQCNETDILFDVCYELLIVFKNVKERQKLLGILSGKLGKQLFYGGDSWNVSDIAISSTIKQISSIMLKDCSPNIFKWLDKCETLFYN